MILLNTRFYAILCHLQISKRYLYYDLCSGHAAIPTFDEVSKFEIFSFKKYVKIAFLEN